jgi:hypothetical protein
MKNFLENTVEVGENASRVAARVTDESVEVIQLAFATTRVKIATVEVKLSHAYFVYFNHNSVCF